MLRHILLIDFQDDITNNQLKLIKQNFLTLTDKIKGIIDVEWGYFSSPEQLNNGFQYCVLINFINENARNNYLTHPEHKKLQELFVPYLKHILVFDYVVAETPE